MANQNTSNEELTNKQHDLIEFIVDRFNLKNECNYSNRSFFIDFSKTKTNVQWKRLKGG
jgi:hypothetical protein